ncbi:MULTISPECIES: DNA/RNA non-specific endonuclease [unclassified Salinibacterium]|uniref:DNA/RNA non-specific endonuclease n=1 Tax=unclassified Salinibacterium TaxID=2632331 RepID=UPI0018CF2230|nr:MULTISPECIES: DNA/RNA non-specific endonuclease [unclassified Salinibacterium]MBH0054963.1 DNA/RNA non-specific endonuclease [Salinibacterium sp. SWN139]MBH0083894.1 DNA/RNA non-specific endonuclease [Salinibacterium sp. SWN167]
MDAASLSSDGYDADFLGVPVPWPSPASGAPIRELPYAHFSVNLDPLRGLASATGVNIDGDQLVDVGRGNDWHLDSRIPEHEQTGEAVYARNDLDRGHLVRRRDPVWGDGATASQANYDTFAFTNAAPQAAGFNQSKELWLGLEDHVLEYARTNHNRISVFTAPVLGNDDPVYRGVGIPQLFWKIAAWVTTIDGAVELRAAGFVLDQRPQLADVDLDEARAQALANGTPPPLGPFRTFQVPIVDIAELTGLTMDALSAADVLEPILAATDDRHEARWVELSSAESVRL